MEKQSKLSNLVKEVFSKVKQFYKPLPLFLAGAAVLSPLYVHAESELPELKESKIVEQKDYGSKKCIYCVKDAWHVSRPVRLSLTYSLDELIKNCNVKALGCEGFEEELTGKFYNINDLDSLSPVLYGVESNLLSHFPCASLESIYGDKLFSVGVDDTVLLHSLKSIQELICDLMEKVHSIEEFEALETLEDVCMIDERNYSAISNLLEHMNTNRIDTAAILFGATHAKGMAEELAKNKVSYFILESTNQEELIKAYARILRVLDRFNETNTIRQKYIQHFRNYIEGKEELWPKDFEFGTAPWLEFLKDRRKSRAGIIKIKKNEDPKKFFGNDTTTKRNGKKAKGNGRSKKDTKRNKR